MFIGTFLKINLRIFCGIHLDVSNFAGWIRFDGHRLDLRIGTCAIGGSDCLMAQHFDMGARILRHFHF